MTTATVHAPYRAATNAPAVLALLGRTGDEVAASLARQGVTGIRFDAAGCPLARYLRREYPECDVVVTAESVTFYAATAHVVHLALCAMPEGAAEFVRGFDHGLYPHLRSDPYLVDVD